MTKFDYEHVYRGKSIIIYFDDIMGYTINSYPYLKFHLSNDRYFGSQYGFIYSKHLNRSLKHKIDQICTLRSFYERFTFTRINKTDLNQFFKRNAKQANP